MLAVPGMPLSPLLFHETDKKPSFLDLPTAAPAISKHLKYTVHICTTSPRKRGIKLIGRVHNLIGGNSVYAWFSKTEVMFSSGFRWWFLTVSLSLTYRRFDYLAFTKSEKRTSPRLSQGTYSNQSNSFILYQYHFSKHGFLVESWDEDVTSLSTATLSFTTDVQEHIKTRTFQSFMSIKSSLYRSDN